MINDIINGIASALHQRFGAEYAIYKEDISQGFTEPCFSIVLIRSEKVPYLKNRYLLKHRFDVHFFPKPGKNKKSECYDVADTLHSTLEYINVLDFSFRGTKMTSEIVDGVLHFFVEYDKFIGVAQEVESQFMESLTNNLIVEE